MGSPAAQFVEIIVTPSFQRDISHYRTQFRSVDATVFKLLVEELQRDPTRGSAIPNWASKVYKIRCANSDIGAGKRGGFRLIYEWHREENKLWLLRIYTHAEMNDIPAKEITKAREAAGIT